MDIATLVSVISVAFLASISHCTFMCGGFVIAYSTKLANKNAYSATIFSFAYQISRIFGYIVLGLLFGFLGSAIIFSSTAKGYIFFLLGIFLVVLGIALIKRGKLLSFIENDTFAKKLIIPKFKELIKKDSLVSFMMLGFLNGFLPCGVVYYFLALSLSSRSALHGSIIMLIFGLSTLPVMLFFSGIAHSLSTKFKSMANLFSSVIISLYGIYLAYLGFMAIK